MSRQHDKRYKNGGAGGSMQVVAGLLDDVNTSGRAEVGSQPNRPKQASLDRGGARFEHSGDRKRPIRASDMVKLRPATSLQMCGRASSTDDQEPYSPRPSASASGRRHRNAVNKRLRHDGKERIVDDPFSSSDAGDSVADRVSRPWSQLNGCRDGNHGYQPGNYCSRCGEYLSRSNSELDSESLCSDQLSSGEVSGQTAQSHRASCEQSRTVPREVLDKSELKRNTPLSAKPVRSLAPCPEESEPEECLETISCHAPPTNHERRPDFTERRGMLATIWSIMGYNYDQFSYGSLGTELRTISANPKQTQELNCKDSEFEIMNRIDLDLYTFLYAHKKISSEYHKNFKFNSDLCKCHMQSLFVKYRGLKGINDVDMDLAYYQRGDFTIGVVVQESVKDYLTGADALRKPKRSGFLMAYHIFGAKLLICIGLLLCLGTLCSSYPQHVKMVLDYYRPLIGNTVMFLTPAVILSAVKATLLMLLLHLCLTLYNRL